MGSNLPTAPRYRSRSGSTHRASHLVSLRPRTLLAGNLLGLGALIVVQYPIWLVLGAAAFLLLGENPGAALEAINLSGEELLLVFLYALGGYALYATLMARLFRAQTLLSGESFSLGRFWSALRQA